jgi:hypothetical protein
MPPMARLHSSLRPVLRVVLAVTLVACIAAAAWACPTCREDLANNPQGRGLATGFYYSILFMMSMPFLIIGTLGTVAYRSVKRAQAERNASADAIDA